MIAYICFISTSLGLTQDPRFDPYPAPPQQAEQWTAPAARLPEPVVTAAATLFHQGLADPRGCDYREVTLLFEQDPDRRGGPDRPRTHAWVLPAEHRALRFAVAWNGLVYPVAEIGDRADLDADIVAVVISVDQRRAVEGRHRRELYIRFGDPYQAEYEWFTVHQQTLDPVKVMLLLRLGRGDLAEAVWNAGTAGPSLFAEGRDPYILLAMAWTWQLFDRAATAHSWAEDALALATARNLTRLRVLIEAAARDRAARYKQVKDNRLEDPLRFLTQLPVLLADQERRINNPPRAPATLGDPKRFATPSDRIDALMLDLEEVRGQRSVYLGASDLGDTQALRALIAEGDAAVPALLDCLAFNNRLTRILHRDDRHGSRYLQVEGVWNVALRALVEILGTDEFGMSRALDIANTGETAWRRELARKIRAYWVVNRGRSPQEKLFQTLADNRATVDQWLDASNRIVRPSDVHRTHYAFSYTRPGRVEPPPFGESLRSKANPSVTDLLARRARQIDPAGPITGSLHEVGQANTLADDLARWDPKGAVPTLSDRFARCAGVVLVKDLNSEHDVHLASAAARYTMRRILAGDAEAALDDYAAWIAQLKPDAWSGFSATIFQPLWRHADRPAIARAAAHLFGNPDSAWVPLFRPNERGWRNWSSLVSSPLLGVAPFRKLVLDGLADARDSGSTVTTEPGGRIEVKRADGSTFPEPLPGDPRPEPGTTTQLRLQDFYADALSRIGGAPRFDFTWPQPDRDRAIAACRAYLEKYSANFAAARTANPPALDPWPYHDYRGAQLRFEPLGRPATPDDVANARAIFFLEGKPRLVPLQEFPLEAEWTTYQGAPMWQIVGNAPRVAYNRRGWVWQAEENDENGQPRRYYGFVGQHVIARAPAEEIVFPTNWESGFYPISPDLDAHLDGPAEFDPGATPPLGEGPLPVTLTLRNHRGIDTPAPDGLVVSGPLSLRDDLTIRLLHTPPHREGDPPPDAPGGRGWTECPMRQVPRHNGNASTPLAPTATRQVLSFDLRDLFDVAEPGLYRLEVRIESLPQPREGLPDPATTQFTIR
jgi:hypothetical protein